MGHFQTQNSYAYIYPGCLLFNFDMSYKEPFTYTGNKSAGKFLSDDRARDNQLDAFCYLAGNWIGNISCLWYKEK
jgi:hypothetical protein